LKEISSILFSSFLFPDFLETVPVAGGLTVEDFLQKRNEENGK